MKFRIQPKIELELEVEVVCGVCGSSLTSNFEGENVVQILPCDTCRIVAYLNSREEGAKNEN